MFAFVAVFVIVIAILLSDWTHCNFSCHNRVIIAYFKKNKRLCDIIRVACGYRIAAIMYPSQG